MKLTPLDIKKQEFRKILRGFDPLEVGTFLEMVAEEYERVLDENKHLNQQLIEIRTKLKDYQDTEKTLRETLLNVQEVKKQSEESSRRQADLIIKESELKAMEIIEMARKQARQMRDEVNMLRSQKESFINRLRQILISQIELLSVLEIDDALPEEAHQFMEKVKSRKKNSSKSSTELKEALASDKVAHSQLTIELDDAEEMQADEKPARKDEELSGDVSAPAAQEVTEKKPAPEEAASDKSQETAKPEKEAAGKKLGDEDINDFFKRGIQIDELIKNLDKKQQKWEEE